MGVHAHQRFPNKALAWGIVELNQIDTLLERYGGAENRIAANLVELDDNSTYKLMSQRALTGVTAKRLEKAIVGAPKLWGWFVALQETLTQAREMRGSGGMSGGNRAKLGKFLTGPSVDLSQMTHADLGVGASQKISIEALLKLIRETYEPVSAGVAEVDERWRDMLPRAEAAKATLARVSRDLDELGIIDTSVGEAQDFLATAEKALLEDPLSLPNDAGAQLDRLVGDAARVADRFRKGHDELDEDMSSIEELLSEIRLLRSQADAALAETHAKIKDAQGLVRIPSAQAIDGPKGLASQADSLLGQEDLPWQTKRQRLDLWLATAKRLRTQLLAADAKNEAPLQERDGLRGLLSGYQAKLAAMGLAEDPAVNDMADDAHNELYTKPCDLDRAKVLVDRVGAALRAGGT